MNTQECPLGGVAIGAQLPCAASSGGEAGRSTDDLQHLEGDPVELHDRDSIAKARRRRYLPGAATSTADFAARFNQLGDIAGKSLARAVPTEPVRESSILERTRRLRERARGSHPEWDDRLVTLAAGALAVYRMRLVDMFMREHVLLLYIIEGERFLRVHKGIAYFYHGDGAFQPFKGVPPEATFGRVKLFLLRLEGLFRLLPESTRRDDDGLLEDIDRSVQAHEDVDVYFVKCADAAIFCVGDGGGHRSNRQNREAEDSGPHDHADSAGAGRESEDAPPKRWPIYTAQALSRIGLSIQKELLGERLIAYVIEWCETESRMQPGCCYRDASIVYDDTSECHVSFTDRGPQNNIYVRIPHPLLCPVVRENTEKLQVFYSRMFWRNLEMYECCASALALATRLENIDRCFMGVSPGGSWRDSGDGDVTGLLVPRVSWHM